VTDRIDEAAALRPERVARRSSQQPRADMGPTRAAVGRPVRDRIRVGAVPRRLERA
jgi:hypothetical protein